MTEPENERTTAKVCHACKRTFENFAIHCLCWMHDPGAGWWWCSKECRASEHRKEVEGER